MPRKLPKLDFSKSLKIELGCGKKKPEGFIGIDMEDNGQEIVWDIKEGIPLPDESADEINSCHFLEHLDNDEVTIVFKEIYRVLKKDGTTFHRMPYAPEPTAFYPSHKSFWNTERIQVMCHDVYQGAGKWNFEIIQNQKRGNQLYFKLKKK